MDNIPKATKSVCTSEYPGHLPTKPISTTSSSEDDVVSSDSEAVLSESEVDTVEESSEEGEAISPKEFVTLLLKAVNENKVWKLFNNDRYTGVTERSMCYATILIRREASMDQRAIIYRGLIATNIDDNQLLPFCTITSERPDIGSLLVLIECVLNSIRGFGRINREMSLCYENIRPQISTVKAFIQDCFERDIGSRSLGISYTNYSKWDVRGINDDVIRDGPDGLLRRDNIELLMQYLYQVSNTQTCLNLLLNRHDFRTLIDNSDLPNIFLKAPTSDALIGPLSDNIRAAAAELKDHPYRDHLRVLSESLP
jgi:hypothetical protein